jgi:hypothetical protein
MHIFATYLDPKLSLITQVLYSVLLLLLLFGALKRLFCELLSLLFIHILHPFHYLWNFCVEQTNCPKKLTKVPFVLLVHLTSYPSFLDI